jgi:hypothetical protein
MTIAGYLGACAAMTTPEWFYDNSPRRCLIGWHGRDCSTFVAFALANSGYPGINLCNNSFGFARMCYNQPRPDWFVSKFGPGQGTFISYDQAKTVTCWGFRGNEFGMGPDHTGDGHIETIVGNGTMSVGAHSHATGIGFDPNGINSHNLSYFAVPPHFLGEMAFVVLDPTTINALKKLKEWEARVTAHPLRFGDTNHDVTIMIDLLRLHHFVRSSVAGNAYGKVARTGVYKFKKAVDIGNTDGTTFGGTAASELLHL